MNVMIKKPFTRVAVALGAGALLAVAVPLSASAHVTVSPYSAKPGSYALVTFTVPNESATASTIAVEVNLPAATPFTSVSYVPVPGWTTKLVTSTLVKPIKIDNNTLTDAVTRVIWTANPGSGIAQGQLQLFPLSLGAIPNTGQIQLNVTQTYSDGTTALWNQAGVKAENPAPVLYVTNAPVGSHDADTEVTAQTIAEATPAASNDIIARSLAIGGLVFGAVGIVLTVVTLRRRAA